MIQQYGVMTPLGFALMILFVFFLFSRVCDFAAPSLHLPFIVSTLSLIALLFSGNIFVTAASPIGRYLLLLTGWLVLTIPFSNWRGGSFGVVIEYWPKSLAVFLVISGLTITLRHSMTVMRTMAYSMQVAAALALLFGTRTAGRLMHPVGMYTGPNELATAMLLGCIYSWFVFSNPAHGFLRKLTGLLPIAPMSYVLMQTGSRAGMVSLVVMLLVLFGYYSMGQRVLLFLLLTIGLGSAVILVPGSVRQRYLTLFSANVSNVTTEGEFEQQMMAVGSSNQRWYLLKTSIILTLKHPLFGVGPGQFVVAENSYARLAGRLRGSWLGTHNTYTELSSEAGIPALTLFVLCMLACRKELAKVRKSCKNVERTLKIQEIALAAFTLRLVLLCLAVFYIFEHGAYSAVFPALAGMILAFTRAARVEVAKMQPAWAPEAAFATEAAVPAGR